MKRLFIIIIVLVFNLIACTNISNQTIKENNDQNNIQIENNNKNDNDNINQDSGQTYISVDGEMPITKALVSKMLALSAYSEAEIQQMEREIKYEDTQPDMWFDKYINVMYINNCMKTEGNSFNPLELLSYKQAKEIATIYNINLNQLSFKWEQVKEDEPISFENWYEIYCNILNIVDLDREVVNDSFIVVGTPSNIFELNSWEMVTDKGKYSFEGLTMDQFINKKIKVIKRGEQIIAVTDLLEQNPVLTNIYIDNIGDTDMTVFVGGAYRVFQTNRQISKDYEKKIADLYIENDKITACEIKDNKIRGKVDKISSDKIVIEGKGTFPVDKEVKIYSIYDKINWKTIKNIIVGYDSADFIIKDGVICAALITNPVKINNIRVVLNTNNSKSLVHSNLKLTSDVNYTVQYGDEKIVYEKNKEFELKVDSPMLKNIVKIYPNDKNGKLKILSFNRSYGNPVYRGSIEVFKEKEGLNIINELPFEEYLYSVVPSEMPTSYGAEALKVQAICARSYAYNQFLANKFCEYGAHVDDSVSCQVYNNTLENEATIQAVKSTNKLGLYNNNEIISAYFFSTSCGYTSDSGDVWANYLTKDFPTETPNYLKGKAQSKEQINLDLRKEDVFAKFIKNNTYNTFDSKFPWYRWNVTMTREQLEASINSALEERFKASPKSIKILGEDDKFRSRPIKTIGKLKDIKVYSRGKSGIITELLIIGTEATIKVATEYNIRALLAPKKILENQEIIINKNDGSNVKYFSLMPSAYFTFNKKIDAEKNVVSITFYGGGYGHGVGMSQNGVKAMVDLGYKYQDILKHYFDGVEIKEIY